MNYSIQDGYLPVRDFHRLFSAAGWGDPSDDVIAVTLKNSFAVFSVTDESGRVLAMARLIGDGAMAFYLKDVVVDPAYQGQGIGKALLKFVESYILDQMPAGAKALFELTAAKGKEGFYQKLGFTANPNDNSGPGLTKHLSVDCVEPTK